MNSLKATLSCFFLFLFIGLAGCGGGGDDSGDFPYLESAPQVTYKASSTPGKYDVTVTLEANGPNPIYAVGLWIHSKNDGSEFDHLDLVNVGGHTWSATTNSYLPLPAGSYYLDSIMIEDEDKSAGAMVRSGWYFMNPVMSGTHYTLDQRLSDWSKPDILEYKVGVSNIAKVEFTLP